MKFGTRGIVAICIWGTFDLLVFNVILGWFCALVTNWPVPLKQLAGERNRVKFGIHVILASFDLLVPKLPVTQKRLAVERNE